ncbi:OmpW/AlkL family protein [Brevundimonas sp.]|uniref:OmpW/AlkL family protein n=1 Tax=Brevundimonas sp. TaxID=1871086 RepID=UPI003D097C9E
MPALKRLVCLSSAVIAAATLSVGSAAAQSSQWSPPRAGDVLVTGRVTSVAPATEDGIFTAAGTDTGLNVDVSDDVMPTLGFTYFLRDNLAVEAILGATRHTIHARGNGANTEVHETWVLPPVVTLQYRPLTTGRISPYVGAGLNGMIFFDGQDRNGFTVDLDDGLGYALQAGSDIGLRGPWSLNVDVKKIFFNTQADINGGALRSDVDLDPLVASIGLTRKF